MEPDFNFTETIDGLSKQDQDLEYIKLMKSETAKSGVKYNWDIKMHTLDPLKIKEINDKMMEVFPNENSKIEA